MTKDADGSIFLMHTCTDKVYDTYVVNNINSMMMLMINIVIVIIQKTVNDEEMSWLFLN